VSEARPKLLMAQEIILRLDEAQDFRGLSTAEANLQSRLKKRILGWLVIEKVRKIKARTFLMSRKEKPTHVSSI
jgi:hypothetical protein